MSDPLRPHPSVSPVREKATATRKPVSSRRQRPSEMDSGAYGGQGQPYPKVSRTPGSRAEERDPIINHAEMASELGRKKSLIRPERQRMDRNHPNYYYRQHAHHMDVLPSTTGNDPILEDAEPDQRTVSSATTYRKEGPEDNLIPDDMSPQGAGEKADFVGRKITQKKKLQRRETRHIMTDAEKRQLKLMEEQNSPPSVWNVYCSIVTFWAPDFLLKCFGMPMSAQRRAWREKMGLISVILMVAAFVGFLTFGFTEAVCQTPGLRLRINKVTNGYMVFHGDAYFLDGSQHPPALGIPANKDVLYDLPHKYGGQDGSFMFQQVNGACSGMITRSSGSDVPTNSNGDLAWYFPCIAVNQDGSSVPNTTGSYYDPSYYFGYACHTTSNARHTFYNLRKSGEVYFTWDDIRNTSRNLFVYSGAVIDLDLVRFFNKSQVAYPAQFDEMRANPDIKGLDMTHVLQSQADKRVAKCMSQIMKVGNVDTETVGCIASKVVLYVSLVFILSIVMAKFVLALLFQWFLSRKYAAAKTSQSSDPKKRARQIEEWSDDIYKQAPRLTDPASTVTASDARASKRSSTFLPQTSRFSSPYAADRSSKVMNKQPTTMGTQSSGARMSMNMPYKHGYNASQVALEGPAARFSVVGSRSSLALSDHRFSQAMSDIEGPGPEGFIHENVVPQPPPEWQPFGYPLVHTICLVTAYSEGADGIRGTLDSIVTTDYPNSHKCILVICDGTVKGKGETLSTPDIVLSMMGDFVNAPEDVEAFSYVAVATGSKRHNMAKVYAGFYDYGRDSRIPPNKQQRVPMLVINKCGTPAEASKSKPGNRGKRDSQIILMSFLQKVMFDERMTELEYEIFNGIWKVTGMSPDFYETVLMVDADTKVFPDSLTHMNSAMVKDPEVMGLCGETKIANKRQSWVTMIQVFEYFISHHLAKSFESVFGGVTCLPGCFSMYRIKSPKGGQNYWVPILANPDIVEHYSENVVESLHDKNLLLLGEDRYLSTLMLKTFPKRKQVFVPQAVCKTTVPDQFSVLLSQRRRWINSTIHNLMELVLVRDLCGTFCFSMQFVVFIELVGTLVLPAAISFTIYLIIISIVRKPVPIIPLVLLALVLGLPGVLIVMTAHRWSYLLWMTIYLLSLPIWNFVLPVYAYWKFDDFSWGDTRKTAGEVKSKGGHDYEGEFDSSKITMKRWGDFERGKYHEFPQSDGRLTNTPDRRLQTNGRTWSVNGSKPVLSTYNSHEQFEPYSDY